MKLSLRPWETGVNGNSSRNIRSTSCMFPQAWDRRSHGDWGWPSLSRHEFGINANCADGGLFAGYWGNWPNAVMGWFVGADLDGYGGCPLTNIAPGIGYPTGWNNVSIVWGPTQAIGIGVELNPCGAVPIQETSWGKVKALFR